VPKNMNCDQEFDTKDFNKLMEKDGVKMWYSGTDEINKNAIVERLNRTLAMLLQRWRIGTGSYDWYKVLPDIISNYNNTFHSTIHAKPIDVFNGKQANTQTETHLIPTFKVGDTVRTKLKKKTFDKGDVLTYSTATYEVVAVKDNRVQLKNMVSKEVLKTLYKMYEIVKVGDIQVYNKPNEMLKDEKKVHQVIQANKKLQKKNKAASVDTASVIDTKRAVKPTEKVPTEYVVEKIVGEGVDSKTGRKIYEIKWKDFPSSENTWESYQNVRSTQAYSDWRKSQKK
jgi:hypothetical protein